MKSGKLPQVMSLKSVSVVAEDYKFLKKWMEIDGVLFRLVWISFSAQIHRLVHVRLCTAGFDSRFSFCSLFCSLDAVLPHYLCCGMPAGCKQTIKCLSSVKYAWIDTAVSW